MNKTYDDYINGLRLIKPKVLVPHMVINKEMNVRYIGVFYTLRQYNAFVSLNSGKIIDATESLKDKLTYINNNIENAISLINSMKIMIDTDISLNNNPKLIYNYLDEPNNHNKQKQWYVRAIKFLSVLVTEPDDKVFEHYADLFDEILDIYNLIFVTYDSSKPDNKNQIVIFKSTSLMNFNTHKYEIKMFNPYKNNHESGEHFMVTIEHMMNPEIKYHFKIGDIIKRENGAYERLSEGEDEIYNLMSNELRFRISDNILLNGISSYSDHILKLDLIQLSKPLSDDEYMDFESNTLTNIGFALFDLIENEITFVSDNLTYITDDEHDDFDDESFYNLYTFITTIMFQFLDVNDEFKIEESVFSLDEIVKNFYIELVTWQQINLSHSAEQKYKNPFKSNGVYVCLTCGKRLILYVDNFNNSIFYGNVYGNNVIFDVTRMRLDYVVKISSKDQPYFDTVIEYINQNNNLNKLLKSNNILCN